MPALETYFVDIPQLRPGSWKAYLAAILIVALATGLRLLLGSRLEGAQFITFFPAIIVTSLVAGMAAGGVAVLLSALAAWVFVFTSPWAQPHFYTVGFFLAVAAADVVIIGALRSAVAKVHALNHALRSNETKFRGLVEAAPDAMVIVDAQGIIALVNAQAEAMFGYRRGELEGQPVELLIPGHLGEQHRSHVAGFVSGAKTRPMGSGLDLRAVRKNGREFPVEISLSPLQTADGMFVSSAIRDVSTRRRIEAELARSRDLEQAASRAKTVFLSNMSHELRTPLNAVIGFAQLLEAGQAGPLTDKQREYVEYIHHGGTHLLKLVNEVLDLSTIEAGRLKVSIEPTAVHETLESVKRSMMPIADKAGVTLTVRPSDGTATVRADRLRLHQCLINLASNAIKYNRRGGSVTLDARPASGDRILFMVTDTGPGISTEHQKDLFQPFQRLGAEHTSIEGTGLGLALTRRLVEAMKGTIGFTSEPGQGSRFWIELPSHVALPGDIGPADVVVAEPAAPETATRSLLYIEDNVASLRLVEAILSITSNFELIGAQTAEEGLELARTRRPDVILLDINLPGMSGYEALARLKEMPETRDVPVIALTASALPGDIMKGIAAGFFRYLTKPIETNAFLAALEDALSKAAA